MRRERYTTEVEQTHPRYSQLARLGKAADSISLHWVAVEDGAEVSGRSLAGSKIRTVTGVSVVGVLRGDDFILNPEGGYRFQPGDIVGVLGGKGNIKRFKMYAGKCDS